MRKPRVVLAPEVAGLLRAPGDRAALDAAESRRLRLVLRLKPGADVMIFDGKGFEAEARIASIRRADGAVEIEMCGHWEGRIHAGPLVTIACAWPKGKRAAYLVEKCVEAGARGIIPVEFSRSAARPAEGGVAMRRWRRIAESAARQSARADVPEISPPISFAGLVGRAAEFDFRYVALAPSEWTFTGPIAGDPKGAAVALAGCDSAGDRISSENHSGSASCIALDEEAAGEGASGGGNDSGDRADSGAERSDGGSGRIGGEFARLPRIGPGRTVLCLIGPEGGFSEKERLLALDAGFAPFRLGPHVLRVETAAVIACAVLMLAGE
ncbi:MAG: 16S rRNA (uracil(1498)-N(3))-methyltransferase [Planctomycetota bacterium]|nr:16S rRNA (uracil(1498)-N(3))-methyltransferase [Planctomycetota bacterium]